MSSQGLMKGTAYLLAGQGSLVAAGAIINIFLGRILGPEGFGLYSVVISLVTLASYFLISGIPKSIAYYSVTEEGQSLNILKSSLILSIVLSIIITALIIILSPVIAFTFKDQGLTPLIQVVALTLPALTIISVIQGHYNGKRDYKAQAFLTILLYSSRIIFIVSFVYFNVSIARAVVGYTISPLIPLIIGLLMIGFGVFRAESYPPGKLMGFALPFIIYSVSTFFFLNVGLFYVKMSNFDDASVGLYSAAATLSQLPYLAMVALNNSIFPAISSKKIDDKPRFNRYVSNSVRYCVILAVPLIVIVAMTSRFLLTYIYTGEYAPAADTLAILIIGISIFALFSLLSSVISSTGRPEVSMAISMFIIVQNILLLSVLGPIMGIMGVASATLVSSVTGLVITIVLVRRLYCNIINFISFTRIFAAGGILFGIMTCTNLAGISVVYGYIIGGISYFLFLWILGEIVEVDIKRGKSLLLWEK